MTTAEQHELDTVMVGLTVAAVADAYGITVDGILGRSQVQRLAWPRAVLYYLLHTRSRLPATDIGKQLDRHHSTVLRGIELVARRIKLDPYAQGMVDGLTARLAVPEPGPEVAEAWKEMSHAYCDLATMLGFPLTPEKIGAVQRFGVAAQAVALAEQGGDR